MTPCFLRLAARACGRATTIGVCATEALVMVTTFLPWAEVRTSAVHREESGIHRSGRPMPGEAPWPFSSVVTAAGSAGSTTARTHLPPTLCPSLLKRVAVVVTAGAMSGEAATARL